MAASWTSVQIVTLAVSALTPITVAGLGVMFARASRRLEQVQWGSRRNLAWWHDSMAGLFSTDKNSGLDDIQAAYDELGQQFRADLYVTHQARPLLATRS